ncbi:hypothetical protein FQA39_LY05518 [Lamprigera yunnana]|nr:hypothetical protein FQA39_LY05518 [Lamprigera yunnana]
MNVYLNETKCKGAGAAGANTEVNACINHIQQCNCSLATVQYLKPVIEKTEEGELVQPRGANLKNAEQQWCSGCGSNGHLEQNCCYYNRTHAPRSVFIYNYEDVYKDSTDNENEKQSVVPNTSSIDTTTKESANDDCYIFLTQTEHQRLCATEGKKFLQLMQTELNVTVEVNSLSSDKFKYIVIGDPTKVNEGKCAITRFCVVQDLLKYSGSYYAFKATPCTLKSLEENFKYLSLSVAHWRSSAKKLYYQIQGCKYFKDLDVRKRYIKLNSVVNSFLQEPNAIQHMDILKCCVRERKPVVEESFNYIFNNDKELFPNYRKVISTLPAKNYMIDLKPIKVEKLKQIVTCICKRLGRGKALKKIKEKYLQLIIKNYPDRLVELFNKEVQQLITAEKGSRKKCN